MCERLPAVLLRNVGHMARFRCIDVLPKGWVLRVVGIHRRQLLHTAMYSACSQS